MLSACALSHAADGTNADSDNTPAETKRDIDWATAVHDSGVAVNELQTDRLKKTSILAVPLLLPPMSIDFSDATSTPLMFATPKILTDTNGYAAVSEGEFVDILIDGSNRTFTSKGSSDHLRPKSFDGDVVFISNGAQISIGRYGALYNIQLLCKSATNDGICVTSNMVKETVESLTVNVALPNE